MTSERALALQRQIEIFSVRKLSQENLKPWTEIEEGLYLAGSPSGELKVDAYLGVNEKAPLAGGKASLWMPIHDRPPFPGVEWLDTCVNFVLFCQKQGWSTVVYCTKGMSRSAMVMIGVYMKKGLSVEQATAKVLAKRAISPNSAFIEGLYEYETYLKKSV